MLLDYLAVTDAECPRCGYNLRASQSSTCSECGEGVRLTLTNYPTRLVGHNLGLGGLAGSALLLALFGFRIWPETSPLSATVAFAGAIYIVYLAHRWFATRPYYATLPRHKKQERVALCWAPFLVIVLLWFF